MGQHLGGPHRSHVLPLRVTARAIEARFTKCQRGRWHSSSSTDGRGIPRSAPRFGQSSIALSIASAPRCLSRSRPSFMAWIASVP